MGQIFPHGKATTSNNATIRALLLPYNCTMHCEAHSPRHNADHSGGNCDVTQDESDDIPIKYLEMRTIIHFNHDYHCGPSYHESETGDDGGDNPYLYDVDASASLNLTMD